MLFNSLEYVIFYLIVLALAWMLVGVRSLRFWLILIASIYFYASNNGWQTFILLGTTTIDYFVCLWMARVEDQRSRRALLCLSLVSNLGALGFFKYFNFFQSSIESTAHFLGLAIALPHEEIALPVGISFFTFEALSYTIDTYRREIPVQRNFPSLLLMVSLFPHLIAGPIVRARNFFPQIGRRPTLTEDDFDWAVFKIFSGLLKKIVCADLLALYADAAFAPDHVPTTAVAWIGVYAFAFQIYFDFSGYTDIALGCAKLLGFDLPENFRRPYAAASITDFWRRWHMSLSSWLRDYLYISLGGNRQGRRKTYRNLMITMLLGGLWHGAAWSFVVWGGLHGVFLSVERALGVDPSPTNASVFRRCAYFQLVVVTWIPFRAEGMDGVLRILKSMLSVVPGGPFTNGQLVAIAIMAGALAWQLTAERIEPLRLLHRSNFIIRAAFYVIVIALTTVLSAEEAKTFIYFRF